MQNGPNNNCFKQICCEKWPKNRISDVNFSDLQWRSNDLRSQFCQLLLLEILEMNYHSNFQVPKWSLCAISRTYKITRFWARIFILPPPLLKFSVRSWSSIFYFGQSAMTLLCHLFLNFWMNRCQFCYLLNEDEMLYRILLNLPNLVELRRGDFLADALGEYKFLFYFIVSLLLLLNWDWTLSLYFIYMILKLANHVNDNHTFVSMKVNCSA